MFVTLLLLLLGAFLYFFVLNPEARVALVDRVKKLFKAGGPAAIALMLLAGAAQAQECRTLEFVQSVAASRGVKITELEKGAKNRLVDWVNAKPPVTNDKWDRVFYAEHEGNVVVFFMRGACIESYIVLPVDDFKAAVKPSGTAI